MNPFFTDFLKVFKTCHQKEVQDRWSFIGEGLRLQPAQQACSLNKDHQKMMVDPMFMIVKSLRSFLTTVTPTAVAPTAVILTEFTRIYLNLPDFT